MVMDNKILRPTSSGSGGGLPSTIDGGAPATVTNLTIDGGSPSQTGPLTLDAGAP